MWEAKSYVCLASLGEPGPGDSTVNAEVKCSCSGCTGGAVQYTMAGEITESVALPRSLFLSLSHPHFHFHFWSYSHSHSKVQFPSQSGTHISPSVSADGNPASPLLFLSPIPPPILGIPRRNMDAGQVDAWHAGTESHRCRTHCGPCFFFNHSPLTVLTGREGNSFQKKKKPPESESYRRQSLGLVLVYNSGTACGHARDWLPTPVIPEPQCAR